MANIAKILVEELIPPFFVRGCRFVLRRMQLTDNEQEQCGLKEAGWYDNSYEQSTDYHNHYTESRYYFLWSVIADRIMRSGLRRVLDLGCGPGQFAYLLYDKGLKEYRGLDFSYKAIETAKQRCPSFEFKATDIYGSDILEVTDYDCIVALEFLEHVQFDTEVINRIRSGIKFYGTVPNFPYVSHVRHFSDEREVRSRYQHYFSDFRVDTFLQNPKGTTYYLIEGTKS